MEVVSSSVGTSARKIGRAVALSAERHIGFVAIGFAELPQLTRVAAQAISLATMRSQFVSNPEGRTNYYNQCR